MTSKEQDTTNVKIEAGMKVSWTHSSTKGRTLSMRLRDGTVEAIDANGMATIRLRSKRTCQVAVARLRAEGQPSQIDEFMDAMRRAHKHN